MPSTPLFAPHRFPAQRTPSLIGAAVILYLTGTVAVTSGAPFSIRPARSTSLSLGVILVAVLVGGGIGAAGIWVVSTVLVHLLSQAVAGSGSVT
jgi:hypothetical protein